VINFKKLNIGTKKKSYPLILQLRYTIAKHDAYSFQNGYFVYHQISITLKDKYKITFLIDWGALTLVVMPFGV
jgi:hypothetical protein